MSDDFLPDAALSFDEDRHTGTGGLGSNGERRAERGRGPHDLIETERRAVLLGEWAQFARAIRMRESRLQCAEETVRRDGLDQEILSARPHGFDSPLSRAIGGDNEHGQLRTAHTNGPDEITRLAFLRPVIDHDGVDPHAFAGIEQLERIFRRARSQRTPASAMRHGDVETALRRLVIDQQQNGGI